MFHHRINRDTPKAVVFHWLLLSFMSGDINSGGLLACGKFVSHVTGFYTLFGQSVAQSLRTMSWDTALGLFSIPFYFLLGAMLSAYLVERPRHLGKPARYTWVMSIIFLCVALTATLGHWGFFGEFGDTHLKGTYLMIALLGLASGLQNGAVSVSSASTVRITHMTGNTTDLGIGIVRTLYMKKNTREHADESRAVQLRIGIITSFAFGSAVGAILFLRYEYNGFWLPAAIAFYTLAREAISQVPAE